MQENQQIVPPATIGKNKFVTWNPALQAFEEFSIKIGDKIEGKNYVDLLIRPPVIRSGFLAFQKNIYYLSLHDILRGHFNVTKPYARPATTTTAASPRLAAPVGAEPTGNTVEPGPGNSSWSELDKDAYILQQEQIEFLLNS